MPPWRGSALWVGLLPVAGGLQPLEAQSAAPPMGSVVQPLAVGWERCKARSADALKHEGYTGLLESGNGWIAQARGTSASITCIGRSRETILVIVTAGGQLAREAKRLFDRIQLLTRADSASGPPEPPPPKESPNSGWLATAEVLGNRPGQRMNFWCPPGGSPGPVFGDEVYSSDSSVCTAAVHAGTLTFDAGGNAIIELRSGQVAYGSSTRNGVSTRPRDAATASFVVIGRTPG